MRNMDVNTQLRHLSPKALFKLCQILDECGWKDVMSIIPSNPLDLSSKPKYRVEQIRLVENYAEKHGKSYTEILLQEWGTSGRVRPTLKTFLDVLVKAQLFRAADYVAVDLLKEAAPSRPTEGPAAIVDVDIGKLITPVIPQVQSLDDVSHQLTNFTHDILFKITDGFSEEPFVSKTLDNGTVQCTGHKLGAGAFGSVYYGVFNDGKAVAVKKLVSDTDSLFDQFKIEIETLATYKHENLLPLIGYSCDSAEYCLVYEFMANRSLMDRLSIQEGDIPLHWFLRLKIAIGVCKGIHYLHTSRSPPLIHRDVKSANILLDSNMNGRLGDFGLVKTSPAESRMTSNVFGTSAYMAPEAFRGDVSVKMDVFSMGVVLLELLTALPPYDDERDGADLVTFIDGVTDSSIEPVLDTSAGWDLHLANKVFDVSQQCLLDKKKRPLIGDVVELLSVIIDDVSEA